MTLEEKTETGNRNKGGENRGRGGEKIPEGKSTRAIEQVTARAPTQLWLWMAGASIAGSLVLFLTGRRQAGIYVGLWPLTFLVVGNYNKIVKSIRSTD